MLKKKLFLKLPGTSASFVVVIRQSREVGSHSFEFRRFKLHVVIHILCVCVCVCFQRRFVQGRINKIDTACLDCTTLDLGNNLPHHDPIKSERFHPAVPGNWQ